MLSIVNFLFFLSFPLICFSQEDLVIEHLPFHTKQHISRLRFISADGLYTYYQRRTGELLLSTQSKITSVLKGNPFSHYILHSSLSQKKLVIERDESFHQSFSLYKENDLFISQKGSDKTYHLGLGLLPQLHREDTLLSYLSPSQKKIYLFDLEKLSPLLSIQLNSFTPRTGKSTIRFQRASSKEGHFYYTDQNQLGLYGLFHFDFQTKSSTLLYKTESPSSTLLLCEHGNKVYSYYSNQLFELDNKKASPLLDIKNVTNLYCSFSKERIALYDARSGLLRFFHLADKKLESLSLKTGPLVEMDGTLLSLEKDQYLQILISLKNQREVP